MVCVRVSVKKFFWHTCEWTENMEWYSFHSRITHTFKMDTLQIEPFSCMSDLVNLVFFRGQLHCSLARFFSLFHFTCFIYKFRWAHAFSVQHCIPNTFIFNFFLILFDGVVQSAYSWVQSRNYFGKVCVCFFFLLCASFTFNIPHSKFVSHSEHEHISPKTIAYSFTVCLWLHDAGGEKKRWMHNFFNF